MKPTRPPLHDFSISFLNHVFGQASIGECKIIQDCIVPNEMPPRRLGSKRGWRRNNTKNRPATTLQLFLTLRVDRRPHRKISLGVSQGNSSEGRCSLVRKTAELVVKQSVGRQQRAYGSYSCGSWGQVD